MEQNMSIFLFYKKYITKYSTGRILISLLIMTWIVFGYMIAFSIPQIMEYADGMELLDLKPLGYSHNYVQVLFEKLGNEGRHLYLTYQIPIDMIYPILFALCYSILTVYLFDKIKSSEKLIFVFSLIPVIAGMFDYLENIGIIIMLKSYPDISSGMSLTTSIFSIGKSSFTTVFWLLLIYALLILSIKYFKNTQKN